MGEGRGPQVHIVGGGTAYHIRPNLSLSAVAYGRTARRLRDLCAPIWGNDNVHLHLTRMANSGMGDMETNEDVRRLLVSLVSDPCTKVLFLPVSLVDFTAKVLAGGLIPTDSGKREPRLRTKDGRHMVSLDPAEKLIPDIRHYRKDVFLVGFRTTAGSSEDEQFVAGLELIKSASCNLVFSNDMHTRVNVIVAPEQARYYASLDKDEVLERLTTIVSSRSGLTFTRTCAAPGEPVPWSSRAVPEALRAVLAHCNARGAYKPLLGIVPGYVAARAPGGRILTTARWADVRNVGEEGLTECEIGEDRTVTAYGQKPSFGVQDQISVFQDHPDVDCLIHFHCPLRSDGPDPIPVREQWPFECGSHESGANVSSGMRRFGESMAVMLRNHGPAVAFSSDADPDRVISFIERNFDLLGRTDSMRAEVQDVGRELKSASVRPRA